MNSSNKKFVNPLEVHVEFECVLSSACCFVLASEILRYVLYQRHQIPLQVQVLQREVEKQSAFGSVLQVGQREPASINKNHSQLLQLKPEFRNSEQEHTEKDGNGEQLITDSVLWTSASLSIKKNLQQSRMKQAALRQERLWRRYFSKVENFVQHFQMITQALHEEVIRPGSEVRAVRLALGTAYVTARELYTLHFPRSAPPSTRAAPNTHSDAAITRALFRSFVTSEELTKLVNTSTGLKRIWIMVLKPSQQTNNVNNSITSATQPGQFHGLNGASTDPLIWLPRLQYKPLRQARLVNIYITAPDWVPPPSPPPAPASAPPTPTVAKTTRGRRLLPSLVQGACNRRLADWGVKRSRDSEGDLGMEDESFLKELDHFELSPLNSPNHFCTLTTEKKFIKPFVAPPSRVRRGQKKSNSSFASPRCAYSSRGDNVYYTPSADVDLARLDMIETPVATSRSAVTTHLSTPTAYRQDTLTRPQCDDFDTPGLDCIQKAPWYHGEQHLVSAFTKHSLSTCEKHVPLPMVETPIVGSHQGNCSLSNTPMHQIRFKTPTSNSLHFGKPLPCISMYERNVSSNCMKLAPVPMIETPIVSSYGNYELKTPCTSSRGESSSCKKLVPVPIVATPDVLSYGNYVFRTQCIPSVYGRDESSTGKKLAPVPMVETPIVSPYGAHEFKNLCSSSMYRRDESSTRKTLAPISMVETPVVSTDGRHESGRLQTNTSSPSTPIGTSNAIAMTKCKLSTDNNNHSLTISEISLELPSPEMFELSDDRKVDSACVPSNQSSAGGALDTLLNIRDHNVVDMIQTPVVTAASNHRYNAAATETCSDVCGEAYSMVADDQVLSRRCADGTIQGRRWTAAAAAAGQERASEGLCNHVATPYDRRVQQARQRPLSVPAKASLQVAVSSDHEEGTEQLVWYQLSLPLVGFKDKPVSRSVTNNIDNQGSLPF